MSLSTVSRLHKNGHLHPVRVGPRGRLRFDPQEVKRVLEVAK